LTPSQTLEMPVSGIYAHTPWRVDRIDDLDDFLQRCQRADAKVGASFQHSSWLRSWYACLGSEGDAEPLLLSARPEGAPADALLLPLVKRREGLLTIVEHADAGITDYNAPLRRDGLSFTEGDARALWSKLRGALSGCDVLRLDKLAPGCAAAPGPWLQMLPTRRSELFGNRFRAQDRYEDWMAHIGKHARKEFERCWRVFRRSPQARFVMAANVEEGLALLRQLSALQHERQAETPGYRLAEPAYNAFYEHYLQANLDSGRCVFTALMDGEQMVAGLFSIFDGERFTMLRIAMAGERWKACAPGKLLLERSIHAMHERGCREFDFAIGDYLHKKVFCTTPYPLFQACIPLSLKGRGYHVGWQLKQALKAHPRLLAGGLALAGLLRGRAAA
jgi:CelD/BcsL family acetyltransferase involved in cellulose biosynthesis